MRKIVHAVLGSAAGLCLATAPATGPAFAQDAPSRVSGSIGAEVATHFVLYGEDVHAQGGNWSRPSVFTFSEVSVDFDLFDLTTGVWFDLRDETGPLGGAVQEVDWYIAAGADFDRLRVDVGFEAWHFGIVENVLDVAVAFDDSDMLIEGFALNPSVLAHTRLSPGRGTVLVLGIAPSFDFDLGNHGLTVAVPAAVGLGVNDYYADNGYAYASVGLAAAMPLGFIPPEYGLWELTASTIYYFTDDDAIGNPRDNFITGAVGVSMSF